MAIFPDFTKESFEIKLYIDLSLILKHGKPNDNFAKKAFRFDFNLKITLSGTCEIKLTAVSNLELQNRW